MLTPLVFGMFERAKEIARWENGGTEAEATAPPRAIDSSNSIGAFPHTAEFRIRVQGVCPREYIVTVAEVNLR